MYEINAYRRMTRHFSPGWAEYDAQVFVADVKLTPPRVTVSGNGHDQGDVYVQHARAPAGVDLKLLVRALQDTLSGSGCQHEYDCCGCSSFITSVKHLGNRRLLLRTRVSYNY